LNDNNCILIVGATGTVGREVLKAAAKRNTRIRILVRSKERLLDLPKNVDVVVGDLSDSGSVQRALEGISAAFYVSPHLDNEELIAEQFTLLCNSKSIRIIFVGVHVDGINRCVRWIKRMVFSAVMSHYRSKLRLSERVRQLAEDAVILMPTNFFQNDELIKDSILSDGLFPQPLGLKGINRVDCQDIAEAAMNALTDEKIMAGAYPIVGPKSLTGPECAAIWSNVIGNYSIGKGVRYCEDDLLWESSLEKNLDGKKRIDLLKTYRLIRKFKLPTYGKHVAITQELLGRPPRSYKTYVEETFAQWR
jgi:uncharacterized protein YbjT (DUF2867 family)